MFFYSETHEGYCTLITRENENIDNIILNGRWTLSPKLGIVYPDDPFESVGEFEKHRTILKMLDKSNSPQVQAEGMHFAEEINAGDIVCFIPVSYTHLDVYKRQGSSQSSSGATEDVLNFASSFAPDIVDVLSIGLLEANSDVLKNIGQSLSNISQGLSFASAIVGTGLTLYETSMNIEENYNAGASEGKMRWDAVVDIGWDASSALITFGFVTIFALNPLLALVAGGAILSIYNGAEVVGLKKAIKDLVQ